MSDRKWVRYRFWTLAEDFRPIVFNPSFPWWCSGERDQRDGSTAHCVIAYLPAGEPLEKYWDDAQETESQERSEITFTDRFPRPAYYVEMNSEVPSGD